MIMSNPKNLITDRQPSKVSKRALAERKPLALWLEKNPRHTLKGIAKVLGVTPFAVYRWADGSRRMDARTVAYFFRLSKGELSLKDLTR